MPLRRTRLRPFFIALTTLAIAACEDTLTTSFADLPNGATADLGTTVRDEVEAAVSGLTMSTSLDPLGTAQAPGAYALACVTPSTPADSDGDGVPDDATYLFTAPPCNFTGWRGGTLELVGQLRIQDPAPAAAGFGYDATLSRLLTRFTSGDGKIIYDVRRDGTRLLSGNINSLSLTSNLQLTRTFVGKSDAEVSQEWTLAYTPATPLQINTPLPSGSFVITGTSGGGSLDWTRGTEHFVLTVVTTTPLHYNADCTDTVQRIDAGELRLSGTFDDRNGTVLVRWSECGEEPSYAFDAS